MKEWLLQAFTYDRWANERVFAFLEGRDDAERAYAVMSHIADAHTTWLNRTLGRPVPDAELPARERLETLSEAWKQALAEEDLGQRFTYKNLRGETFTRSLFEVAWHVLNHATYHRGHVRGIYEGLPREEVLDTDLVYFFTSESGK